MVNIAIFASGGGSNAEKIIHYFKDHEAINVALVVSNKADAGVLSISEANSIPSIIIDKSLFRNEDLFLKELAKYDIKQIVLAGFLLLIPPYLIKAYTHNIINIHPSLLPKYGGKGMYGIHVHTAVHEAKEVVSGITVHLVDEVFDHGKVVFQKSCKLDPADDPKAIAKKVLALEHEWYPLIIEQWIMAEM